jgi:hypothetical protein
MQPLNDDNMDELFQRAAEHYPLRIAKSDWEKIAQQLESSSSSSAASPRFNRRHLSILAVLFFVIAGGFYAGVYFTNKKIVEAPEQGNNKPGPDISLVNRIADDHETRTTRSVEPVPVLIRSQKKSIAHNHNLGHSKRIDEERFDPAIIVAPQYNRANKERRKKEHRDDNTNDLLNGNKPSTAVADYTMPSEKKDMSTGQSQLLIPGNKDEEKSGSDIQIENKIAHSSQERKNNDGRFYAGIVLGPQLNQVKGQGFNRVGGELGLLVGYSLSKKFSLESGLILSNKRYYSDGQYFKMEKIAAAMPPGMKVLTVESRATVLEVPLKGRYNLITKKNGSLFITAGASSSLLLHEQNNYTALVNGGQQDLKADYGTMRHYFATSINLSAGFEKRIGEKALLRIEPYLGLPVKGLGVGSMSVFSAGLHLGLTIPVRKK